MSLGPPALADVQAWLRRLYLREGAALRKEERQKAEELVGLLGEVGRAVGSLARSRELVIVDAAAGKSYVGLLSAQLVLAPAERPARVVAIEREADRVAATRAAAARLEAPGIELEVHRGRVGDLSLWPEEPSLVVALHACGAAFDEVVAAAVARRARLLLLVPCCIGGELPAETEAIAAADRLGIPHQAAVRRAFVEAWVAALRTHILEAAGYQTEVFPFVSAAVTPYHLVWRARRVGEPVRSGKARAARARMEAAAAGGDPGRAGAADPGGGALI